jgi:hypothetical protein
MLITKEKPVGIDIPIQQAQTKLFNGLADIQNYDGYGRCYRNKKGNGYIAEVYTGKDEYKEVYLDDTLNMISFFGVADKVNFDIKSSTMVHLVVFVNLEKVLPDIDHRADEEIRLKVLKSIGTSADGLEFQSMETGIENVLREYPGSRRDDGLIAADMSPWHCFRLNFKLIYDQNAIC